jgi:hypothetical protein
LLPGKTDFPRRVAQAVVEAGGRVEHWLPELGTGGFCEAKVVVYFAHEIFLDGILKNVGSIPGVSILHSERESSPP